MLTDMLYALLQCRDESSLNQQFVKALAALGVRHFGYVNLSHLKNAAPRVSGNYPPGWVAQYCRQQYQFTDPTVMLCQKLSMPFSWEWGRRFPGETVAQYWEEATAFGLQLGASVPLEHNMLRSAGIGVSVDSKDDSSWLAQHQAELAALCHLYHYKMTMLQKDPQQQIRTLGLSLRELECAHWLCAGLSLTAIGSQMAITERTVRFHLQQLKRKLQCSNQPQLIARLVSMELVRL